MNYINTITNEYPVFEIHIENRGKGFAEYEVVNDSEVPPYNRATQVCREIAPIKIGNDYFRDYEVTAKSERQLAAERKALVPKEITPKQLRLQLLKDGVLDDVEEICAKNSEMKIWFEFETVFKREYYMIDAIGLTSEQVDTLFINGSKI